MYYKLDRQVIERAKRAIGEGLMQRRFSSSQPIRRISPTKTAAGKSQPDGIPDSEWPAGELYARINSLAIDRHDTIVDPAGVRLDDFVRNPVLLWQHGIDARGNLPIGTVPELEPGDSAIDALIRFDLADPFSANVHRMFNAGIMKGFSIGFIARASTIDEVETTGVNKDGTLVQGVFEVLRYTDWELVELSCVAVPSNPDALSIA